ncbi:MAG: hypothetical protein J1E40_09485 [Oscillospiraceae bacterium]|nr:hypothetical protein [Oscillospiraceae bacterium]
MKELIYKLFVAILCVLIFLGMLRAMRLLSDFNDYQHIKRLAERNMGLTADGPEIPAASGKAPIEEMRTYPATITAEDMSYIYLDGIRYDFPITLAKLQENFDMKTGYSSYYEKLPEYLGHKILLKNGIGTYTIEYIADSKDSIPEECIVTSISTYRYNKKYFPQLVIAGIDIFDTSPMTFMYLADYDKNKYPRTSTVIYSLDNYGCVVLDFNHYNEIKYYKNDDPRLQRILKASHLYKVKETLRLPEDYDPDVVPASKDEIRKFAMEYYYDRYYSQYGYAEKMQKTFDKFYLTAYEFLYYYEAEYYTIESLKNIQDDDLKDTGYILIDAYCYIEGYYKPVKTEMILKEGESPGNALIIYIDL